MSVSGLKTIHSYRPASALAAESLAGIVYLSESDLVVYHQDAVTGVQQQLARDTHYTLGGDGASGQGTITAVAIWPDDDLFHVERQTARVQEADIDAHKPLPSAAVERSLDRTMLAVQELDRESSYAVRVPRGEAGFQIEPAATRANRPSWFNNAGALISVSLLSLAQSLAPSLLAVLPTTFKGDPGSAGEGFTTRAALAAFGATPQDDAYLTEAGREGKWIYTAADISAQVGLDPYQGIALPHSGDASGATGGWLRAGVLARQTQWQASWFGVVPGVNIRERLKLSAELLSLLGGGVLQLPAGVLQIVASNADDATIGAGGRGAAFYGLSNVLVRGCGPDTVLKLVDASGFPQTRTMFVGSCTDCLFEDFTVHGNADDAAFVAATTGLTPEQMNGIFSRANTRVTYRNIRAIECQGDGFNFGGEAADITKIDRNILLENCGHDRCYRNGITVGGSGWDGITVRDHYFGAVDTQQWDCEPTSGVTFNGIKIINPTMVPHGTMDTTASSGVQDRTDEYAFVFSGHREDSISYPCTNVEVRGGNAHGSILVRRCRGVLIDGLDIYSDNVNRSGAIEIDFDNEDIKIINCPRIEWQGSASSSAGAIYAVEKTGGFPTHILVQNNRIISAGQVVYAQDCDDLSIIWNRLITTGDHDIIVAHAQSRDMSRLRIKDNIFNASAYSAGRKVSSFTATGAYLLRAADISGNRVIGANAITFVYGNSATLTQFDVLTFMGNQMPTTCRAFREASGQHRHTLLVGGSLSGGGPVFSVYGTPEAVLTASTGAMATRRDGAAATSLYIKESGTGNTGWVAK